MYACHPKCTEQRSGNQKLQHALHWCDYCHLHLIKCFLLQAALVPKCKATDSLWHSWHYCGKRPMPFGTSMLLTHARSSVGFFFFLLFCCLCWLAWLNFKVIATLWHFLTEFLAFWHWPTLKAAHAVLDDAVFLKVIAFLGMVCVKIVFSVYVSLSVVWIPHPSGLLMSSVRFAEKAVCYQVAQHIHCFSMQLGERIGCDDMALCGLGLNISKNVLQIPLQTTLINPVF